MGGVLADADRDATLILGEVTDNPKKQIAILQPMADYAASKLGDVGIKKGAVFMAKNKAEMILAIKEKRVDWITDSPFPALIMVEQAGAELFLRRWKNGVAEYRSLFVVKKDSPIADLPGLAGKKVAFSDPFSTTSYFVPMSALRNAGLNSVELKSPRETPPSDKVGYVFAKEDVNVFTWVQRGLVEAGTGSNTDLENNDTIKAMAGDLKVLHQTDPFPRAVELVRPDLDPKVKTRLKEVLMRAHEDPAAADALKAYKKTKQFDDITSAAQGMDTARQILEKVKDLF
jgi:phosphonate transport system substrate-binding protein